MIDLNHKIELSQREEELQNKTFTQEQSPLSQLNKDFSFFEKKSFIDWLQSLNEEEGSILEVGGGPKQVAAEEILNRFPQLIFWEIELRPIDEEIIRELSETYRYYLFNMGLSQALSQTELLQKKFNLIFAHNVLLHLPNPFFIIEKCYQLLEENGLLFVNGILIYEEEWEKIAAFLDQKGFHISWIKNNTPSHLLKKGIVDVSLTIIKNQEELSIPFKLGNRLTDFYGNQLETNELFFQPS